MAVSLAFFILDAHHNIVLHVQLTLLEHASRDLSVIAELLVLLVPAKSGFLQSSDWRWRLSSKWPTACQSVSRTWQ